MKELMSVRGVGSRRREKRSLEAGWKGEEEKMNLKKLKAQHSSRLKK
jgi:hypothetical protein